MAFISKKIMQYQNVKTYYDLRDSAFEIINLMSQPIGQVCGPITWGGTRNIEINIERFKETISKLVARGDNIFNQIPFEKPMQRIKEASRLPEKEENDRLLNEFYLPIFESGFVKSIYFIHGWESSYGATWERKQAIRLGLNTIYLPSDFIS